MEIDKIVICYITHADINSARLFVDDLVAKKLCACGNIFDIDSCYLWERSMVKEDEYVSILKTTPEKINDLLTRAKSIHPYETPCFIHWEVNCNLSYAEWIRSCLIEDR